MQKIYLVLILILGTALNVLQAQITLTANNNMAIGDEYSFYRGTVEPIYEGDAGANVTWDFSNTVLPDFIETIIKDPTTIDLMGDFTNANMVIDEGGGFTYYLMDGNKQAWYGVGNAFGSVIVYSDPQDLIRYPMTYGDSFTDNFAGTFPSFTRTGDGEVTCDAYGTLITPAGTFDNVIRVKTIMDYNDFTNGIEIGDYHEERFWWFNATSGFPIFNVNRLSYGTTVVYTASYTVDGVSAITDVDAIDRFSVFPNPTENHLMVEMNLLKSSDLKIQLVNVLGQVVRQQEVQAANGMVNATFATNELENGWYVLNVMDGKRSIATYKVQVQH